MSNRLCRPLVLLALCLALAGCGTTGSSKPAGVDREKASTIQVQLGGRYMQQGKLDLALERLLRAVELNPRSAVAHSVLAIAYEQIGNEELAAKHYERSVELPGSTGDVRNNYGQFLCRRGRYDQADAQFQAAFKDPFYDTQEVAATNAGICARSAGRLDVAERYLRAALEKQPGHPAALLPMAAVQQARKQHLNARAFLQRYEALGHPVTAELLALGYEVETSLGDARTAADYRARLQRGFPSSPEARRFKE